MPESFFTLSGAGETLWSHPERGLRIVAGREPAAGIVRLLESVDFGSEGIRYRRLRVTEQLAALPDAVFFSLVQGDRPLGAYASSAGGLRADDRELVGLYRGLLCVDAAAQGTGLGRELVTHSLAWLEAQAVARGLPTISYGCIERSNTRSLALLESLGARELGLLQTLSVYRQWPRSRLTVDILDQPDSSGVRSALAATQADCGLRSTMTGHGRFFAVTDAAGIVAGATATVTRVAFERIGGAWDWLSRSLFRLVPPARRRFDPDDFAYLRLNDVIARPGHEKVWRDFLSTLLAEHRVHMAVFVLDPRADLTARLTGAGLFGRVATALRQEVAVLAKAWNIDDSSLQDLSRRPLSLGPPDL